MAATSENKPKQYISVGILAHVDAGKTTLSEGILYLTGQIRSLEELTMEMRFWTCIRWREAGGLPFFQAGEFCAWRQAGDSS